MDIKQMYQSVSAYEAAMNKLRKEIVEEIAKKLVKVELPEAKRISSSPLVVVVKASVVFSNSWNMSAEYYISESQTRLLIEKIQNKQTISEIKHFIDTVISDNYIRVDSKNKMFINTAVKQALIEIAAMLQ